MKKISLMSFPTKLSILEFNRIALEANLNQLSRMGLASLLTVGTQEG